MRMAWWGGIAGLQKGLRKELDDEVLSERLYLGREEHGVRGILWT